MSRSFLLMTLLAAAAFASGCGSRPLPVAKMGVNCLGMADDLKTLRAGDELPRVIQVIGMPNRATRSYSLIGRSHDVLEYDVGTSPCVRAVLHTDKKLYVLFDHAGRYLGHGDEDFVKSKGFLITRTEPLMIDPVVLNP